MLLVGEGPDREGLTHIAGPGVELRGASDDLSPWYAAADVVVPSRWEGKALEAMASGRSVVVTQVDGARETVGPDAGAVVAQGEPAALVEAVAQRLTDLRLRGREEAAGRARAVGRFDVRVCAARVGDAVAGLLRG